MASLVIIMSVAIAITAFLLIFPVELPDKTFIATLVLATRYKPLAVWIGVSAAFAVQTVVAVTLGGLIGHLPRTPVEIFAGLMFLTGGVILIRGASTADAEEAETEHEFEAKTKPGLHGWRTVAASFLVLFVAEWGDLSQLLTAGLVVKYGDPVSVGVGAFLALVTRYHASMVRVARGFVPNEAVAVSSDRIARRTRPKGDAVSLLSNRAHSTANAATKRK